MPKKTDFEAKQPTADAPPDAASKDVPTSDQWYKTAVREAYHPELLKTRKIEASTVLQTTWSGEVSQVQPYARVKTVPGSIVVAEHGAEVYAGRQTVVVAKEGSTVSAGGSARVIAEPGSTVLNWGATVDRRPGATVVDHIDDRTAYDKFVVASGRSANIGDKFGTNMLGREIDLLFASNDTDVVTHTKTVAQPGSHVVAKERSVVLAEPGSFVEAKAGSTIIRVPGAKIEADRDAKITDAKGYMGPQFSSGIETFDEGGLKYHLYRHGDNIEVPAGAEVYTNAREVFAKSGSQVFAHRNSAEPQEIVRAEQGSNVNATGNSHVIADAGSQVRVEFGATAEAREGSTVSAGEKSVVTAYSGSAVYARYGGTVIARPGSHVYVRSGGSVRADKGAHVTYASQWDRLVDTLRSWF